MQPSTPDGAASVVRLCCAAVLLVAAVLKVDQFLGGPSMGRLYGFAAGRIALLQTELLLSAWLVSGLAPFWSHRAAMVAFALFACYSLEVAIAGEDTCGCFGRLHVSPWLTGGLDVLVVFVLLFSMPASRTRLALIRPSRVTLTIAGVVSTFAFGFAPYALARQVHVGDSGVLITDSYVVLEPTRWIGKHFPLASEIDIGSRLLEGRWMVVFYRHDCAKCQTLISTYGAQANEMRPRNAVGQLAMIQVPPSGDIGGPNRGLVFTEGQLREGRRWFVETPIEVTIDNGRVLAIGFGESLAASISTDHAALLVP